MRTAHPTAALSFAPHCRRRVVAVTSFRDAVSFLTVMAGDEGLSGATKNTGDDARVWVPNQCAVPPSSLTAERYPRHNGANTRVGKARAFWFGTWNCGQPIHI